MVEVLVRCLVGFAQGNVDDGEVDVNRTSGGCRSLHLAMRLPSTPDGTERALSENWEAGRKRAAQLGC
jgi:hypothetical protein